MCFTTTCLVGKCQNMWRDIFLKLLFLKQLIQGTSTTGQSKWPGWLNTFTDLVLTWYYYKNLTVLKNKIRCYIKFYSINESIKERINWMTQSVSQSDILPASFRSFIHAYKSTEYIVVNEIRLETGIWCYACETVFLAVEMLINAVLCLFCHIYARCLWNSLTWKLVPPWHV